MFGPISVIAQDPIIFVVLVGFFLAGLVLHGVLQARLAARLGDTQGVRAGFGTPEPSVHLGLWGVALYLLLGCGLPRPVPLHLTGRPALGVQLSGPLLLLAWALLLLLLQHIQVAFATGLDVVGRGLELAARASVLHAIFFLLPLPTLDGYRALWAVGSRGVRRVLAHGQLAGLLLTYIAWLVLSISGVFAWVQLPVMNALKSLYALLPF